MLIGVMSEGVLNRRPRGATNKMNAMKSIAEDVKSVKLSTDARSALWKRSTCISGWKKTSKPLRKTTVTVV